MTPSSPTDATRSAASPAARLRRTLRWIGLGAVTGVLAGLSSAGFLVTLEKVTEVRVQHPWLLWLLPVGGFTVGLAYQRLAGRAAGGNALILDEIHQPSAWIPRRMAPLVYLGTEITHLFGGSAGREGTALQMSGSLTDAVSRRLHLDQEDRRTLLVAALGGGFGAVFGVPLAGIAFGIEVQSVRHLRTRALLPSVVAALVGDRVVRLLGVHHTATPQLDRIDWSVPLVAKVALAGVAFGLTAHAFVLATHGVKGALAARVGWSPLRPVVGGVAVILLTGAVGTHDYLGLSIPLIESSLAGGVGIVGAAFALKLLFTAVTLGSGFQGGEVTPLFVIGATLGVTLGRALGVPVELLAAVGFVGVFAGAANVPVACTVMGAELFGVHGVPLFAVACAASWAVSHPHGIYGARPEGDGTMAG
ncbi:MAG: chloride channel protein [Acidimicrobiales bacterium]